MAWSTGLLNHTAGTLRTMTDGSRIFELRTYTASPGRLGALERRFRDHTVKLFERHGIHAIGFFEPVDSEDTLVYILAFENPEAATTSWAAFQSDPEWIAVRAESEAEGSLVANIESRKMVATDFSALR